MSRPCPARVELRWNTPTTLMQQIDLPALVAEAQRLDGLVAVDVLIGQELRRGTIVARIHSARPVTTYHVFEAFATGIDRSFEQDPLLAAVDRRAPGSVVRRVDDPGVVGPSGRLARRAAGDDECRAPGRQAERADDDGDDRERVAGVVVGGSRRARRVALRPRAARSGRGAPARRRRRPAGRSS